MVHVRKLVLAIAAASALNAGSAYALGLGELSLQSSLNQPLVAEIELLQIRDLDQLEIRPSLASAEEFNKAGVDRQFFLTDLNFTPVVRPNGKSVIRVTSSKPVREPYLNFLMEVVWPNGRLLREYTLLVDPPLYSPAPVLAAPSRLPAVATTTTPVRTAAPAATRPAAAPVASSPVAAAPRASAPASGSLAGTEYRTTNRDTLWEIAQRVSSGSVHQTMLAIQDLNPNAFIGGNINRLKTGQVLRLPTEEQIRSRSQGDAVAQVSAQTSAWREGRAQPAGERQLDATKRETAGAAPAQAQTPDNLRLVAADSGKSVSGSESGSAQVKALNDKLAVTQESLDSSRRETADLQGQVQSLESQLDKLERLLEIRNNQLAKLEEDLKKSAEQKAAVPAEGTPAVEVTPPQAEVSPPSVTPVEAPLAQAPSEVVETETVAVESEGGVVEQELTPPTPLASTDEVVDFNYSEEPAPTSAQAPSEQPAEQPAVAVPAEQTVEPAPVAQTNLIDDVLGNPVLVGILGGGAILALLALLMLISRRNAKREADMQEALMQQEQGDFDSSLDFNESSFDGLDELAQADVEEDRSQAPSVDPLGEADICIAYGKFTQAAELLQSAINDEPQRTDLRLKLMEVYAELDDREGFAREENELREIGVSAAQLDQLKAKYSNLLALGAGASAVAAASSLDDFNFDDLDLDSSAPAAAEKAEAVAQLDDSFDLGLDSFDSVLNEEPQASSALQNDFANFAVDAGQEPTPPVENPAFDLDLSFEATEKAAETELPVELDDFSFDLKEGLEQPLQEAELAIPALDDDLLNLGDDLTATLELPVVPELSAEVETDFSAELDLPSDFDLSVPEETPALAMDAESEAFLAGLDDVADDLDGFAANLSEPLEAVVTAPAASLQSDLAADDDFDFLSGTDETATKLDLARAYIDMGDSEGARDILDEVLAEGNDTQQNEARELLAGLS